MTYYNEKLENFKKDINGKKIAIIGMGKSNCPAAEYLSKLGAIITVYDKRERLDVDLSHLKNITYKLNQEHMEGLDTFDYILRSPGVKPFIPEIESAVESGVTLTSEIELLLEYAPCKIIGITGSDGKTTTTTLVSEFLKVSGFNVWVGGNIGTPLFNKLDDMRPDDIIVLELSSFQLMTARKSPNISIITNISPNHLDYHRSYDEYISAKENIFLYNDNNQVVFNLDDEMTERFLTKIDKGKNSSYFSLKPSQQIGVFFDGTYICYNDGNQIQKIEEKNNVKLVGIHNIANICAAASAVIELTGIEPIRKVITTFSGVKHRMEHVATINNVKWYNDSIATSPSRTMAGLNSFDKKIILIAGGYDKNIPYDVIGKPILDKVKELVLLGKTAPKIEEAVRNAAIEEKKQLDGLLNIHTFTSLDECVSYCYNIAKDGDVVVMSPASASFDLYKNFEERGEHFVSLVEKLKNVQ